MGKQKGEIPNGVREERGQSSAHSEAALLNLVSTERFGCKRVSGCWAVAMANADLSVKIVIKERDQWGETEQCRAELRNQIE